MMPKVLVPTLRALSRGIRQLKKDGKPNLKFNIGNTHRSGTHQVIIESSVPSEISRIEAKSKDTVRYA